jgi:hypothetical protein
VYVLLCVKTCVYVYIWLGVSVGVGVHVCALEREGMQERVDKKEGNEKGKRWII